MESGRTRTRASSATSRRELHGSTRSRSRRTPVTTWAPRAAVLAALGVATIVIPVIEAESPDVAAAQTAQAMAVTGYPSTYEVLSGSVDSVTPTSLLAALPGAVRVAGTSRSLDRSPLPDCDGQPRYGSSNGAVPATDLCLLWDGTNMLRGDAAVTLAELNSNFRAAIGTDLCITDSYRTLAEQRRLAYTKGGLAATPGTSNHGWGLAVDLCSSVTNNRASMDWLKANGPTFGWTNPNWALPGGSGPHEPWHWEYLPGTTELGTDYND